METPEITRLEDQIQRQQRILEIAELAYVLEADGFDGWYVLEQDVSLDGDPAPGEGPVVDADKSVRYLRSLAQD